MMDCLTKREPWLGWRSVVPWRVLKDVGQLTSSFIFFFDFDLAKIPMMSAMVSDVGSSIVRVSLLESASAASPMRASMEDNLPRAPAAPPPTVGGLVDVEDRERFFDDMSVAGDNVEPRVDVIEG